VYVLRHVQQAVRPGGSVLDIHPLGIDMAVRAGSRGLGFVDASAFALVVDTMNEAVDQVVSEGLFGRSTRGGGRLDEPAPPASGQTPAMRCG
jgi:hypothetical protein